MSEPGGLSIIEWRDAALAILVLRRGAAGAASQMLAAQVGLALPAAGRFTAHDGLTVLWSGPDRFLAVQERSAGAGLAVALDRVLRDLAHVVEASSSRRVFSLAGGAAADALARLLPIDLHPRAFPAGSVALTMAGHIDVAVWRDEAGFRLACASSFAASLRTCLHGRFAPADGDR